jgi:hypothetical protein
MPKLFSIICEHVCKVMKFIVCFLFLSSYFFLMFLMGFYLFYSNLFPPSLNHAKLRVSADVFEFGTRFIRFYEFGNR